MDGTSSLRVAIVGAGVAGITAAHILQRRHQVTLFETNDYLGGHTHTVPLPSGPDAGTPVDTGFIVFNDRTYPSFMRFLSQLGVDHQLSDMSFSYYNEEDGFQYAGTSLDGLFARRANLFNPFYWAFIAGIIRFSRETRRRLKSGRLQDLTLGDYCAQLGLSDVVVSRYVLPMASAIWSSPFDGIREFPMESFARFYENHGLLSTENRPTWFTVRGGSHTYVRRFQETFKGTVRLSCAVAGVRRTATGVVVSAADGTAAEFDRVVMAAHANQSLHLLQDPSSEETDLLGAWDYSHNRTVLHTDTSFLPSCRRAWASWNYLTSEADRPDDPACLTYHMNRLQQLHTAAQYCVTLNPRRSVKADQLLGEYAYEHPQYDFQALRSQERLPSLNGQRNTYFCGSYFRNGFHEDAVASAVEVARGFGLEL